MPKRDEIQIRRREHHLNPDENENGVTPAQGREQADRKQRRGNDEKRSSLLLHHEHERADQRGSQEHAHALQRPYVAGHQYLADLLHCERANVWRDDRQRLRFENRPRQTAKHSERDENTAPVETTMFPRITARQENGENNQHRHCADINEHEDQADELCAQKEEKGREPKQRED